METKHQAALEDDSVPDNKLTEILKEDEGIKAQRENLTQTF